MDDLIAERELTFRETGTDTDRPVLVRLGRPRREEHSPLYTLRYEIVGPGENRVAHFSCGEDSMQSLTLVFVAIHAHLEHLKRLGRLTWLDSEELRLPAGC